MHTALADPRRTSLSSLLAETWSDRLTSRQVDDLVRQVLDAQRDRAARRAGEPIQALASAPALRAAMTSLIGHSSLSPAEARG